MSLKGSIDQKSLDNDIKEHVNYIATTRCTYDELIDRYIDIRAGCTADMRQTHGLQDKRHSRSTVVIQTTCNNINRIAIQQGLLVKFSYKSPLIITTSDYYSDSLLRALLSIQSLVFVTSGCYNKYLLNLFFYQHSSHSHSQI